MMLQQLSLPLNFALTMYPFVAAWSGTAGHCWSSSLLVDRWPQKAEASEGQSRAPQETTPGPPQMPYPPRTYPQNPQQYLQQYSQQYPSQYPQRYAPQHSPQYLPQYAQHKGPPLQPTLLHCKQSQTGGFGIAGELLQPSEELIRAMRS